MWDVISLDLPEHTGNSFEDCILGQVRLPMKSRLEGADDAVKALINEHRPDLILNAMASRCLFDVITHGE
jgi:hypothetical protein